LIVECVIDYDVIIESVTLGNEIEGD